MTVLMPCKCVCLPLSFSFACSAVASTLLPWASAAELLSGSVMAKDRQCGAAEGFVVVPVGDIVEGDDTNHRAQTGHSGG